MMTGMFGREWSENESEADSSIADFRLPIADLKTEDLRHKTIGNRKSAMLSGRIAEMD